MAKMGESVNTYGEKRKKHKNGQRVSLFKLLKNIIHLPPAVSNHTDSSAFDFSGFDISALNSTFPPGILQSLSGNIIYMMTPDTRCLRLPLVLRVTYSKCHFLSPVCPHIELH